MRYGAFAGPSDDVHTSRDTKSTLQLSCKPGFCTTIPRVYPVVAIGEAGEAQDLYLNPVSRTTHEHLRRRRRREIILASLAP